MSSEYSRSVEDWDHENWKYPAIDIMYGYYLRSKKIKAEAKQYDVGVEDLAQEKADSHFPMMLYCYPLQFEPSEKQIIKTCLNTNCTIVQDRHTEEFFLALTGGGMNLSQDIALAYLYTDGRIPYALALNVSKQPGLSVSRKDFLKVAKKIKEELKVSIGIGKREIQGWNREIKDCKQYMKDRKEKEKLEKQNKEVIQ
jgi:hypothetical protein